MFWKSSLKAFLHGRTLVTKFDTNNKDRLIESLMT